ncbi:MAG: hypothetical protein ACKOYP_14120 [Bacteroidota bacterium]
MASDRPATKTLNTQAEAIVHFIQQLDIERIDMLLDHRRTYQDLSKRTFVSRFGAALDKFSRAGDTFLDTHRGHCCSRACGLNRRGYTFIGNKSGHYMDLIILAKKGIVHDIYECHYFKTKIEVANRNERIMISDTP